MHKLIFKYLFILLLMIFNSCTKTDLINSPIVGEEVSPPLKVPKELYVPVYFEYYPIPKSPVKVEIVDK